MPPALHPALSLLPAPTAVEANFIRIFRPAGRALQYGFCGAQPQSIKQQQALEALLRRQRLLRVVA